jgi:hypothetical protein
MHSKSAEIEVERIGVSGERLMEEFFPFRFRAGNLFVLRFD